MRKILFIGGAGAIGAISRTVIGLVVEAPLATLAVNLIGTFLLCFFVAGMAHKLSSDKSIQDAVTTGFLGSFTTFSTLSMETVLLFQEGQLLLGMLYVGVSLVGGIATGLLGFHVGGKKVAE